MEVAELRTQVAELMARIEAEAPARAAAAAEARAAAEACAAAEARAGADRIAAEGSPRTGEQLRSAAARCCVIS